MVKDVGVLGGLDVGFAFAAVVVKTVVSFEVVFVAALFISAWLEVSHSVLEYL